MFEFGDKPGAANVAKICGNFLIASSIEACAEAFTLAKVYIFKIIGTWCEPLRFKKFAYWIYFRLLNI